MIKFTLPFPPTVNSKYKMSRGKRSKGDKVLNWELKAREYLNKQNILPVNERCFIIYDLYHPDNKERDAANYEKYTTDFLVSNGVLLGDQRRYLKSTTTHWLDAEGALVVVNIYPVNKFKMEVLEISPI